MSNTGCVWLDYVWICLDCLNPQEMAPVSIFCELQISTSCKQPPFPKQSRLRISRKGLGNPRNVSDLLPAFVLFFPQDLQHAFVAWLSPGPPNHSESQITSGVWHQMLSEEGGLPLKSLDLQSCIILPCVINITPMREMRPQSHP